MKTKPFSLLSTAALTGLLLAGMPMVPATAADPHPAVKPAGKPAGEKGDADKVATLVGTWSGGPARDSKARYCVQEGRYDSGHRLIIGRTPAGEVNVGLAIPGAALPVGERWPVTVTVDNLPPRERTAVAAAKQVLVVGLGFDDPLYQSLKRGKQFSLKSDADVVSFKLTGTGKALADLETCVAGLPAAPVEAPAVAGTDSKPDPKPAAEAAGKPHPAPDSKTEPPLPPTLQAVLSSAGLKEVQALVFPGIPVEKRPADYAWRVGKVVGGMRQKQVPAETKFDEATSGYADSLRERCQGNGTARLSPPESHTGVTIRKGEVDCVGADGKPGIHVSLVFYLSDAHMFAVYFHEAAPADKVAADDIRDRLADVFRKLAELPPEPPPQPPAAARVAPVPVPAVKAGDTKPAEPKPVEAKPVETKQTEPAATVAKPTEAKPAETKPVEPVPVEAKPAETKSPEMKPAEPAPAADKVSAQPVPEPVKAPPAPAPEAKAVEPVPNGGPVVSNAPSAAVPVAPPAPSVAGVPAPAPAVPTPVVPVPSASTPAEKPASAVKGSASKDPKAVAKPVAKPVAGSKPAAKPAPGGKPAHGATTGTGHSVKSKTTDPKTGKPVAAKPATPKPTSTQVLKVPASAQ